MLDTTKGPLTSMASREALRFIFTRDPGHKPACHSSNARLAQEAHSYHCTSLVCFPNTTKKANTRALLLPPSPQRRKEGASGRDLPRSSSDPDGVGGSGATVHVSTRPTAGIWEMGSMERCGKCYTCARTCACTHKAQSTKHTHTHSASLYLSLPLSPNLYLVLSVHARTGVEG